MTQDRPKDEPDQVSEGSPPQEAAPVHNHQDTEKIQHGGAAATKQHILFPSKAAQSQSHTRDDWLLTYTDMLTLLITLFVIMLSQASFEDPRAGSGVAEGLSGGKLPLAGADIMPGRGMLDGTGRMPLPLSGQSHSATMPGTERITDTHAPDPQKVKHAERLKQSVQSAGLSDSVDIKLRADNIELRIDERVLFPTAESELYPQGADVLASLLPVFQEGDFTIIIEGHTDNIPIATREYPSNWELAAARALSVLHHLEREGIPAERLQAVSYGETRPVAPNDTQDGRQKNRRVDIILR